MKHKSEVAKVLLKFKSWIENQSDCKVQVVIIDNGIEYMSQNFNSICEGAGIEHQLITPYSPQQSGVSEGKNKSIIEMTSCLLHEKGLPKKFWAEATFTTIFLLNRLPTRVLEKKTPYEVWFDIKPKLTNLKVSCLCFFHVPQAKRDKLSEKAEPLIFVSYSRLSKASKIYQPHTEKMVISRDVQFLADEEWD